MKMKKFTIQLLAVACAMVMFADKARAQATVQLSSHETILLNYGEKDSVKATISPLGEELKWESRGLTLNGIVEKSTADSTWGVFKAPSSGKSEGWIIVSYGSAKDSVYVKINAAPTDVSLGTKHSDTIGIGNTLTLTATVNPADALQEVLYTSSNNSVAEVQTSGLKGIVTAKAVGTARITVSAGKGANMKTDTFLVTVNNPITSLNFAIAQDTIPMQINSDMEIEAVATPDDADNISSLGWSIAQMPPHPSGIVTVVSNSGVKVKIQSGATPGLARLTVVSTNGKTASRIIQVLDPIHVTGMALDKDTVYLSVRAQDTITAHIQPANALNKKVTWASTNPSFASVEMLTDTTAVVTGKTVGMAMIVGETTDGGLKDTCYIYVQSPMALTDAKLEKHKTRIELDKTDTLKVVFTPANATNKKVTWTSDDPTIATVDSVGVVKALKSGITHIRMVTDEGAFKDSCEVTAYKSDANIEAQSGVNIWGTESGLRVQSDKPRTLAIYTLNGALYRRETLSGDRVISLPSGLYVVTLGEVSQKVLIP